MLICTKTKQNVSVFLKERHKGKDGTPTMGGFIFIIPTLVAISLLCMLNKLEITNNLILILFVFIGYAILGFCFEIILT